MVIVLCSPVLINSSWVRGFLAVPVEALGFDTSEFRGEMESSFDNSLVQARGNEDGSRGVPSPTTSPGEEGR